MNISAGLLTPKYVAAVKLQALGRGGKLRIEIGKKIKKINSEKVCPILQTPLQFQEAYLTQCGHIFGARALLSSIIQNKSCPLCRGEIGVEELHIAIAVLKHSESNTAKEKALMTLMGLAYLSENQSIISAEEGIIPLLLCAADKGGTVTIKECALEILKNLACIPENQRKIVAIDGAIPLLFRALEKGRTAPIKVYALVTLLELSLFPN